MRKTARVSALAAVLALVASPAFAAYDIGTSQSVMAGRNMGEHQGWTAVYFHAATGAISYGVTRTHDAQGIPITAELGNNTQSYSASGTVGPCPQHGVSSVRFSSKNELGISSVDFEKEMLRTAVLPGRYLLSITKGADVISLSREFNSFPPSYPVGLTFKSTANVPAANVQINLIQPYAASLGLTDVNGKVNANLSPGWYRAELNNGTTWRTFSQYLFYIGDVPGQANPSKTFVATPVSDPAVTATGSMRVQVNDNATGAAILGVRVQIGGGVVYTGSDGSAWASGLPAATYTVSAGKAGYNSQTTTKSVTNGNVAVTVFNLDPSGGIGDGGDGDDGGGGFDITDLVNPDWWADLFHDLFVPPASTWDQWAAFRSEVGAWGPFGVITAFWDEFANPGTIHGEIALMWEIPFGPTNTLMDLRPALAEEDPAYGAHPESRGSLVGSWIFSARPFIGLAAWGGFMIAMFKWVLPRLTW